MDCVPGEVPGRPSTENKMMQSMFFPQCAFKKKCV